MKIGITGASGMLGTALIDKLDEQYVVFATARSQGLKKNNVQWKCFDLIDFQELSNWLIGTQPDVVIHCAAIVDVDNCENNKSLATKLHIKTTIIIANYLDKKNGQLIYISTDSVFDGDKKAPYIEKDRVNPLNIYAKTKLLGEDSVLLMKNGLVLRTNIIGWSRMEKTSFAEWMLRGLVEQQPLTLFNDVLFSPLHVSELSLIIIKAIVRNLSGLYHISSTDSLSKYDFGIMMADVFSLPTDKIVSISVDDLEFKTKRPKNMALSNKKITNILGSDLPSTRDGINLMKEQLENGWLAKIKGRSMRQGYHFWRL
jgi:dTDP-4-dehydrorhamnose reductase